MASIIQLKQTFACD